MYRSMPEKPAHRSVSSLSNLYFSIKTKKKKIIKNAINVDSLYITFTYNLLKKTSLITNFNIDGNKDITSCVNLNVKLS